MTQSSKKPVSQTFVRVAINVPLSRSFDYRAREPVAAGSRVRVPFGRRELTGVVLGPGDGQGIPEHKLKAIKNVIDADEPLLSEEDLWLLTFCAGYYHHPVGEVVAAALPSLLRQGRPLYDRLEKFRVSGEAGDALKRAAKQQAVYSFLAPAGPDGLSAEQLSEQFENWRTPMRALLGKSLVERFEVDDASATASDTSQPVAGPSLNASQQTAVDSVNSAGGYGCFVLDGVTGSGKTEVYLTLIQSALDAGKQVLVLVPEIGLTPQLVNRFRKRLGFQPDLMHSALTDVERLAAWRRARDGRARLIIGTRSAVFVPMKNPGLVIVDEEHDASLKQQEGFRYSARDLAVARANRHDMPVILGSATPSLELLANCRSGRYTHLTLPERAGKAEPPDVRLVDTSRSGTLDGLGTTLLDTMETHLDGGGQVLLFLNRRGFAPTLICTNCGHIAECNRCDARMTVHARDHELRCHHCGARRPLDTGCSKCGADMRPLGEGTERLEQALQPRFGDRVVRRIDSDSVQKKGAIGEALAAATGGDADILVGTQMLSKGHHFPKLTLVGVVNADQGLFSSDFRSAERLAQSIIQVAGRAGREERRGEVLIQTAYPEHPFWDLLMSGGYPGVADAELNLREQLGWPPYSRLALIRASAHQRGDAWNFLHAAREAFRSFDGLSVLGPVDAPMAKRAGRFRVQLLLKSDERSALHRALGRMRPSLEDLPEARRVRWSVDVDPIELL